MKHILVIFTGSALWAGSVIESTCPHICPLPMSVLFQTVQLLSSAVSNSPGNCLTVLCHTVQLSNGCTMLCPALHPQFYNVISICAMINSYSNIYLVYFLTSVFLLQQHLKFYTFCSFFSSSITGKCLCKRKKEWSFRCVLSIFLPQCHTQSVPCYSYCCSINTNVSCNTHSHTYITSVPNNKYLNYKK